MMSSSAPPPVRVSGAPSISVVVMAYSRREFLLSAVRSAAEQDLPRSEFEIVALTNFADAELEEALRSFGARRVHADAPLVGSTVARALVEARGDVVCFLDDDDEMEPSKLRHVRKCFEEDPGLIVLRNTYRAMDARGRPLPEWPACEWPASAVRAPVTLRTEREKRRSRVLPMYNLSTISVRRAVLMPLASRLDGVAAASDSLVFLAGLSRSGHVRVDPGVWNRHRIHGSVTMETFTSEGLVPPSSPEYLRRSLVGLRQQEALVQGTVAERWARWLYLITRFDAYLGRPEFPPPSVRELYEFGRGLIRERQPFRLWALSFALLGKIAPDWARRKWWEFLRRRQRAAVSAVDFAAVFPSREERP